MKLNIWSLLVLLSFPIAARAESSGTRIIPLELSRLAGVRLTMEQTFTVTEGNEVADIPGTHCTVRMMTTNSDSDRVIHSGKQLSIHSVQPRYGDNGGVEFQVEPDGEEGNDSDIREISCFLSGENISTDIQGLVRALGGFGKLSSTTRTVTTEDIY